MKTATRINDEVIDTAREENETLVKRIARAESIFADLSGNAKGYDTITLSYYGDYVVCDDGQDRWLAPTEEYQSAIDTVLNRCLGKGRYMGDEDSEDRKAAYDDLCSDCPALYSNIGSGSYNSKKSELLDLLAETLDEDTVAEVAERLHIEIE